MSQAGTEWTSISLTPEMRTHLRQMKRDANADSYDSLLRSELGLEESKV